MALFSIFKKKKIPVEQEMYEKNILGYRDLKDRLDHQDALLSRINEANERYARDNDINAIIADYEYAFIEADPPCKSSQYKKLVSLYLKAGMNDKAWSYLNSLIPTADKSDLAYIRMEQDKILKKERDLKGEK